MSLVIPDDILAATGMTAGELAREIAVFLFEKEKLTMGKACRLAAMDRIEFQRLLADRKIPVHYNVAEFESDLETLKELGRI